jgi:ABC-2 type transport system ATP-binding protein
MIMLEDVSKSYGKGKNAVDGLTLSIPDGAVYGFLGPNGAGKSTTIKMIVGLLLPDSGSLSVDGLDVRRDALAVKRQIGFVPDEPLFYLRLTGRQHLDFMADVYRVEDRWKKVDALCSLFEFAALDDEISSYSHGMKQKLAVIGALMHQPKLLILDEPMVGLDPKSAYTLKREMRSYASRGNTVFFSTHVLEVAQEVCTRVGIIDKGKLLYDGTFSELQKGSDRSLEDLFLSLTEKHDA